MLEKNFCHNLEIYKQFTSSYIPPTSGWQYMHDCKKINCGQSYDSWCWQSIPQGIFAV